MHLFLLEAIIGAVVGILVGLTGMGSGVLLLPLLIFGLGVPPIVAVGSDAAFSALTKVGAGIVHWKQGTVSWKLISSLAMGSIPGALGGVLLLDHLHRVHGNGLNDLLRSVIGVLLVCIPLLMLLPAKVSQTVRTIGELKSRFRVGVTLIGVVAGFLVGISSVGSGTIVLVLLVPLVECSPSILVGTDIVHAVVLTSFTSLLYLHLGTVDIRLLIALLVGSIPGALVGVRLSGWLPSHWLKRMLCITLFATGIRILWV